MNVRSIAAVFSIAILILLACVASEQKVERAEAIRVDTTGADTADARHAGNQARSKTIDPDASIQPNIRPLTRDEWEAVNVATDTTQPLRRAPVRVVHFAQPALPTPVLDQRKRECIAYPLTAGFSRVRYNLLLQPNMYEVARKSWPDPRWRETFRVAKSELTGLDMFPVALWRIRGGVATFWKFAYVQAGPGLPTGNPQVGLSAEFFRGGDVLCVEASGAGGPLLIAYNQQTGLVVLPWLSAVQNASNDSTPIPGAWMRISGEVQR